MDQRTEFSASALPKNKRSNKLTLSVEEFANCQFGLDVKKARISVLRKLVGFGLNIGICYNYEKENTISRVTFCCK